MRIKESYTIVVRTDDVMDIIGATTFSLINTGRQKEKIIVWDSGTVNRIVRDYPSHREVVPNAMCPSREIKDVVQFLNTHNKDARYVFCEQS